MLLKFVAFFGGDKEVALGAVLLLIGLFCAAVLGSKCKNAGLFSALSWLQIGGVCLLGIFRSWQGRGLVTLLALAATLSGVTYAGLYCKLLLGRVWSERKKRRERAARQVLFTLPDKDNSYLRSRLNTALCEEKAEKLVEQENAGVQLGYARKMLAGVRLAALSPVERLDVEELSGLVASYSQKKRWSSGDMKALNETLARLLKLAAKYEIAV